MNRSFSEFYNRFLNEYIPQLGITDERNICPKLDALVIGSDEVFNCTQAGDQVGYSLQLFGKDHQAQRLISYAASFGSTTLEKINHYGIAQDLQMYLKAFDAISVRDVNSEEIVSALCDVVPSQNIDPVLLYDFPEVDGIKVEMDQYIVVYAYAGRISDEEGQEIRKFAKAQGKKIVSLGFWQPFCDVSIPASPLEVLAYIKHADYVITDTFHGTVFSIKYQVPFATLIRESNRQKLSDLLSRFGLESRCVHTLSDLSKTVSQPMEGAAVRKAICEYQYCAKAYLDAALALPEKIK